MKYSDFKRHCITRSNPPHKSPYDKYKGDLESDFCERCAYCNLHRTSITTPFEIDHFIPKKAFEGKRDDLLEDYDNLIYTCKKCNIAKSSKYSGDITKAEPTNEQFYNPRKVDFNSIFFRNEYGAIESADSKGREIIKDLKLYRPIHILGWICEELADMRDKLKIAIEDESNLERKEIFEQAKNKIANMYLDYNRLFTASYNDKDFSIEGLEALSSRNE